MNSIMQTVSEIIEKYDNPETSIAAILEDAQKAYGCLPDDVIKEVAQRCRLAVVRVLKTIEHSNGLVLESDLKKPIEICTCPSCSTNGGSELLKGLREILLVKSCCNGIGTRYRISATNAPESPCANPPTVTVNGRKHHGLTLAGLLKTIEAGISECGIRKAETASL